MGSLENTLDIIKSICKSPKESLIRQVTISRTFPTKIVLKQGDLFSTILFSIYINDLPRKLIEDSRISDTINDTPYLDDVKISKLFFTDDLAIFWLQNKNLQRRISILESWSNKWALEFNLNKRKIMIFNKQGSAIRKKIFLNENKSKKINNIHI